MDRRRFLHVSAAVGCCTLGLLPARAEILHFYDAINKSGRQRMLSQRLAKSYLQIGQGIDPVRSNRIFTDSMSLFERQLAELQSFAPTPENRATLSDLKKTWLRYRESLTGSKPNPRDARTVMSLSDEVLALAQTATVQLEGLSGTATGHLVNISGRQRMLSQRMAKFYQAINWGAASSDALVKLTTARDEFLKAMAELTASPKNSPAINAELALAQQQWLFFDQALKSSIVDIKDKMRFATNVATTSERILETMDRITGMYEQLT